MVRQIAYTFLFILVIASYPIKLFSQSNSDKIIPVYQSVPKYNSIFKELMIIPDFQINENRPGDDEQVNCDVASDAEGNFVIVWEDHRDTINQPHSQSNIYAQRYSSTGEPIGGNFLISLDNDFVNHKKPSISMREEGHFVVVWLTSKTSGSYISVQLFNPDGTRMGELITINDSISIRQIGVSMDAQGDFVILWVNELYNPPWQIAHNLFLKIFSFEGMPLTDKIRVNEEPDNCNGRRPSIDHANSGNFVVSWDGGYPSYPFVQIFSSNGNRIGNNFMIENEYGNNPSISMFTNNEFIVTWTNNQDYSIYAQLFSADGTPKAPNFLVNDDNTNFNKALPVVTTLNSGNFAIAWQDERNGNSDIYAQTFDNGGNPLGSNILINDDFTSKEQQNPSIATDGVDEIMIAWQDARGTWAKRDIFFQKVLTDGSKLGNNYSVSDQVVFDYQETPDLDSDSIGNCVVVWEGPGPEGVGIYGQIYTNEGVNVNDNFKIIDGTSTPIPSVRYPSVAVGPDGYFTVVWEDVRNDGLGDIMAQRYTNNGLPIGTSFKVGNFAHGSKEGFPQIAADGMGNFIIVWHFFPEDLDGDIYAQWFSAEGIPAGDAFRINDITFSYQSVPSVAMNNNGEFVVAWQENRWTASRNIHARKFNFDGSPVGGDIKVNDITGEFGQIKSKVAINDDGSFAVTWYTWGTYKDIYVQFYSADQSPIGGNIKVNDDAGNFTQAFADITTDDAGNYFVVWEDSRNGTTTNIFGQLFSSSGTRVGNNFKVSTIESKTQMRPKVVSSRSNFFTTWISNVYGNAGSGDDIWANILSNDHIIENGGNTDFILEQNYPNPFNHGTTIIYHIPVESKVTLKIYDVLGCEITTLVSEEQEIGSYEIEFNTSGLSSGIYFYQLRAGNYIEAKKMVLLR